MFPTLERKREKTVAINLDVNFLCMRFFVTHILSEMMIENDLQSHKTAPKGPPHKTYIISRKLNFSKERKKQVF